MSRLAVSVSVAALVCIAQAGPARALSATECSALYQAAKKDGSLGGATWADFRKTRCGAEAKPAASEPAPADKAAAARPGPAKPAAPAASGAPVFPVKVDPKYAGEKGSKARQKTCLDQYRLNKTAAGNGGLNWIQKGGGYYSECNRRLKG